MNMHLRRLLTGSAIAAAGAAVALLFPLDRALIGEVLLLVVGGLALQALVRQAATRGRSEDVPLAAVVRRRRNAHAPESLKRLEDQVALARATAADFHRHVRPILRDAAAGRLRSRRRIDIAAEPERARALLGDDVWELVRPGTEPPRELRAAGEPAARVAQAIDAIERI